HAIREPRAVVVADPKSDNRFAESPLVVSEPKLRFYAAAPLTTSDGFVVGTLCAADRVPRELSPAQIEGLQALARQVMAQLELRRRRRTDREQSSEKLILEAAGLSDDRPHPASEDVQ
ncbi:MAG TPA: GAF domain-containing protein, partial [Thermoanaerobaculia bacterium]